jgi:hypothetical protein
MFHVNSILAESKGIGWGKITNIALEILGG